ncbi:hypothetical protein PoB_004600400 [Plakobranchus ocellatus]|uniref:Uncharacterized protein n=1 Tax=Plakobranchus ocellatus TaxID=259542 RepID=A0AAV4BMF3_9GAST|nr:hypothetical protein PoB_004600400 [Plakobranchus ocellatus]
MNTQGPKSSCRRSGTAAATWQCRQSPRSSGAEWAVPEEGRHLPNEVHSCRAHLHDLCTPFTTEIFELFEGLLPAFFIPFAVKSRLLSPKTLVLGLRIRHLKASVCGAFQSGHAWSLTLSSMHVLTLTRPLKGGLGFVWAGNPLTPYARDLL